MYVSMYVSTSACMSACMPEYMSVCMSACTTPCTSACMCVSKPQQTFTGGHAKVGECINPQIKAVRCQFTYSFYLRCRVWGRSVSWNNALRGRNGHGFWIDLWCLAVCKWTWWCLRIQQEAGLAKFYGGACILGIHWLSRYLPSASHSPFY